MPEFSVKDWQGFPATKQGETSYLRWQNVKGHTFLFIANFNNFYLIHFEFHSISQIQKTKSKPEKQNVSFKML